MLLMYCRRPKKFQRVVYRRPPQQPAPQQIVEPKSVQIVREVPVKPKAQQVVFVQEPAAKQPVVIRPVQNQEQPVVIRTTMQQTTRPIYVTEQQTQPTTTIIPANSRPNYVVASPNVKTQPVVLFKKK